MSNLQTVARLLALIPYLQAQRSVTVAEVANEFGVSEKQIIDDLQILVFCGLPDEVFRYRIDIDMDLARDEGIISIRDADFLTKPTRFTPSEAFALTVALQAMREVVDDSSAAALKSALDKLVSAIGVKPSVQIHLEGGDTAHQAEIRRAISSCTVLDLHYEKPNEVRRTQVEPVRLFSMDGFLYLEAWDISLQDWRYYRLDRIVQVVLTESSFEPRPAPEPVDSWAGAFTDVPTVKLALSPTSRWVAEYHPVTVVADSGAELVVQLPVASIDWLMALMLRLGADAKIIEPSSARESVKEAAKVALDAYENLARLES